MADPALIERRDLSKRYERPDGPSFDALKRVTCTIPARSMTAIVGRSGSDVKVAYAYGAGRAMRLARGFTYERELKAVSGGVLVGAGVYILMRD